MMFIFRCVLNEEVRTALKDRWKRRKTRRVLDRQNNTEIIIKVLFFQNLQLGTWSSMNTTKGTSSHRQNSPVVTRTLPRLYQTISTLSVQSNATKVTDVSMLPSPQEGPTRRYQTVRTISGKLLVI